MKTKQQLIGIIKSWWDHNQTLAQMPEAQYFAEQVNDWESGFTSYLKEEGWVSTNTAFEVIRAKDVKEGIGIHLKSGGNEAIGILNIKTGEWIDRGPMDTTTHVMRGASIPS